MQSIFSAIRPLIGLLAGLLACLSSSAFAEEGFEVLNKANYSGGLKLDQPMDINLDVGGVKLTSIFFDSTKMQVFAILQNRTPMPVTPNMAVALFDARGKVVATGIDVSGFSFSSKVGPGEQKNIILAFNKFTNDFKGITSYQLVVTIGQTKESQGKPAAVVPSYGG